MFLIIYVNLKNIPTPSPNSLSRHRFPPFLEKQYNTTPPPRHYVHLGTNTTTYLHHDDDTITTTTASLYLHHHHEKGKTMPVRVVETCTPSQASGFEPVQFEGKMED